MTGFLLSPLAEADLDEIVGFIAVDDPAAARRVLAEILAAIERLVENPRLGHRRDDLVGGRELRFWLVHTYLIIYDPTSHPLAIARVLSGYRDIESLLGPTSST